MPVLFKYLVLTFKSAAAATQSVCIHTTSRASRWFFLLFLFDWCNEICVLFYDVIKFASITVIYPVIRQDFSAAKKWKKSCSLIIEVHSYEKTHDNFSWQHNFNGTHLISRIQIRGGSIAQKKHTKKNHEWKERTKEEKSDFGKLKPSQAKNPANLI